MQPVNHVSALLISMLRLKSINFYHIRPKIRLLLKKKKIQILNSAFQKLTFCHNSDEMATLK